MLADASRYMSFKGIGFTCIMEGYDTQYAFKSAYECITTVPLDLQRLKQLSDVPSLKYGDKTINWHIHLMLKNFKDVLDNAIIEPVDNAGHSPHVEKSTIIFDKILISILSTFRYFNMK